MKVSVVIPAFNEERLLPLTIQSVRQAAESFVKRGWDYEIIVCDNNSTDGTSQIAAGLGVKVVFEPVNHIAKARNTGVRSACGDWLIFIDADSQPSEDLFDDVADAILSGKVIAGGATVRLDNVPKSALLVNQFWNFISVTMKWMAGSFIFCRADVFRTIGGFNEELFVSEEIDLSKRIKKLAKSMKMKVVILTSHPLITSGRKVYLYKKREYFWFILKTLFLFGATIKDRESCNIWYDGKR